MLKQRFLVQFGSQFILKIVGMIAGLVVARIAGPGVVGTIAYGTAYISVFGFITGMFSTGHIKAVSEGQDLGKCVSTYTILQGSSMLVYFLAVSGWFLFQKYLLGYQFESRDQQFVIIILLCAHIAALILDFGNVTFTATLEQAKANYPLFLRSIVWQIGRIGVVLLGFKAIGLASWNLIITVLLIPLAWRFIKKLPWGGFSRELATKYGKIAVPVFFIVVINSLIAHSDKLVLAHFTNVEELGFYSAAFALGGMFLLVSRSVGMIFFPLFSKLISEGNWELINIRIGTFHNFISIFFFPILCALVLVAEPFLLTILGTRYQPSVNPFIILLFATYVEIIGMPYGNLISGMGRFYTIVVINVVKLLFFVLFLIYFVSPEFMGLGASGIALNLLINNVVVNGLFIALAVHLGKIKFDKPIFYRHLLLAGLMVLFLKLINLYNLNSDYWWLITGFVALMMNYATLFVFRLMSITDVRQMIKLLDMRKTKDYIKDEFNK
jgi:O-antigen/teichoic acid export membrane protein